MKLAAAIQELHDRCAIYTSVPAAARLLDLVDWTAEADLGKQVLLEPCVGEGAILLEGVRRLLASFRAYGRPLAKKTLLPRIRGFELHSSAAASARRYVLLLLLEHGISWNTALALVEAWIIEGDFLLQRPRHATHVVSNPPYVRWRKLPKLLADIYRTELPPIATRGDLAVAFLYRMQQWARQGGTIVALVSDRWMFAQYGAAFVEASQAHGWSHEVVDERPEAPFVKSVGAYSSIVRISRGATRLAAPQGERSRAREVHAALLARLGTLADAGCTVRVGPALGAGSTFLLEPGDECEVEPQLLRKFVAKTDLFDGQAKWSGRRVIVPYDQSGKLIDLAQWPGFRNWAIQHESLLRARSQFTASQQFWRTIDAVPRVWASAPKLLMPEFTNGPRTYLDGSDSIPAHSIYAIWSDEWPIEVLQRVLNSGLLALTAAALAPRLTQGWVRFYKRFLVQTPLPPWASLSDNERRDISTTGEAFSCCFALLFGFEPGNPPSR